MSCANGPEIFPIWNGMAMVLDIKELFFRYTSADDLIGTPPEQERIVPKLPVCIMEELLALLCGQIRKKHMTCKVIHKVHNGM